jgi:hypothetical protein
MNVQNVPTPGKIIGSVKWTILALLVVIEILDQLKAKRLKILKKGGKHNGNNH